MSTFNLAERDTMPRSCSNLIMPNYGRLPHSCHNRALFRLTQQASIKVNETNPAVLRKNWCAFASKFWRKKGRQMGRP